MLSCILFSITYCSSTRYKPGTQSAQDPRLLATFNAFWILLSYLMEMATGTLNQTWDHRLLGSWWIMNLLPRDGLRHNLLYPTVSAQWNEDPISLRIVSLSNPLPPCERELVAVWRWHWDEIYSNFQAAVRGLPCEL